MISLFSLMSMLLFPAQPATVFGTLGLVVLVRGTVGPSLPPPF